MERPSHDWTVDAKQSLKESALFRSNILNDVLISSSKSLRDQADAVDTALARTISDTHNVRLTMENELKQVIE
jgi:hypothetical protein